jgi:hypothetical protein
MKRIRAGIPKSRVAGALRVLGLLVVVQLVAAALWLRAAHARASDALLSVGAELMKIEGASSDQPARSVFLNGITVHLRAATTDRDLHAVLDRFHSLCRTRTGVDAPQAVLDKLRSDTAKHAPSSALDGVLRAESDSAGAVACIDTGTQLSVPELTSRLQDFARSGDLSAVGDLRYVLARRVDGKTTVLTLWTEGSTPLLKMFPPEGDAPGRDPQGLPRAPGTRRLLSTWENGQPYSLALYTAVGSDIGALRAFYLTALRTGGWSVRTGPSGTTSPTSPVVAQRGSQTILLRVASDSHGQPAISVATLE